MTETSMERVDERSPDHAARLASTRRSSWAARLPALTVQHVLWAILIIAAVVSRFWDLEYRTLHHDESLHTYYSWLFQRDGDYVHNPLMHGPFLFHGNALIYAIFGVSDATSRYLPALFGVLLVWLPWLLRGRRFLGPWGALAAGYMLLISPSFLYYTRYIRHDPYTAAGALLLAIAVFRYLERPQRRWIIIAFLTTAFLLTNHEIVFAILLAMVMVLWGSLLLTHLRPLIPVHLAAGVLAAVVYLMFYEQRPLPEIPWQNPTQEDTNQFYSELFSHPFVLGIIVVGVMFLIACAVVIWWQASRSERKGSINERIFGDARPNTVAFGVYHALRDPAGLVIGASLGFLFFVTLFTTFFTNPRGFATATYAPDGTLLYWLGQHDVQRGEQPWFYFITEGFQYEWLGIFFASAGLIVITVRFIRAMFGGSGGPNLLFNVFNAWWFVFMFLVLSWAGEKMPWLIMHFALPGFLVAASLINELVEGATAWFRSRRGSHPVASRYGMIGLLGLLVTLAASWFFLAADKTFGQWTEIAPGAFERTLSQETLNDWWYLAIPPLAALLVIAIAIWVIGPRKTAYTTITAAFVVFSLFQIHQGFRVTYLDGDVAVDTLIYNTTSPDVTEVTADLHQLSQNINGDDSISIQFDSCVQWPFNWYLRDFPNRQISGAVPTDPSTGPDVILGHPWNAACGLPQEINGYTEQTYVLRWHEPEQQVYREFAIAPEIPAGRSAWQNPSDPHGMGDIVASIWSSIMQATTPEGQQRLFRLVMFREMPTGLTSYEFKVYVRNDLLPYYNDVRYGEE